MLTKEQIDRYDDEGYLVLKGLFTDRVPQLREASERIASSGNASEKKFVRWNAKGERTFLKVHGLAASNNFFSDVASEARLQAAIEDLVGPTPLFRDVLVEKPARSGAKVHFHQDTAYWDIAEPERSLSAWIPFVDVTERNGCLLVVPGSHKSSLPHDMYLGSMRLPRPMTIFLRRLVSLTGTGDNPRTGLQRFFASVKRFVLGTMTRLIPSLGDLNEIRVAPERVSSADIQAVPVDAGDVIIFHGRLLHSSGPNSSGQVRPAYIASYAR